MIYYLYHICRISDKDDYSQGYIGVSHQPEVRWKAHRAGRTNEHLQNAYKKYEDIIEYVIDSGEMEYILERESELRPTDHLGWNIAPGGGLPPRMVGENNPRFGKTHTDEVKKLLAQLSTGRKNPYKGCKGRWTEEQKSRIGAAHKGKTISKEHKEAISNKVEQWTLDGEYIKTYESVIAAERALGKKTSTNIGRAAKGQKKQALGYIWKYVQ